MLTVLVSSFTLFILISLYCLRKEKRRINKKLIKLTIMPMLGLVPFFLIYFMPKKLENKTQKIKVRYINYSCECANWRVMEYNETKCKDKDCETIFLEPLNEHVAIPDTIGYDGDIIELKGKFYSKKGFPKGYNSEQQPEKARVFQYTEYKIIISNYNDLHKSYE
jgi:hypothetical protein